MSHRLLLHLLVSCLGIALSIPSLYAQGGGANSSGGANQVEGTGKGAGGPGDGTGPGQGAGQGLGPGGKSTTSDGSTEATANKQSSGANSGGAANQVEGTGKGAGGPGDGTGPGQGAGQGLGPGGKRPKGQPSKDKNDAHGTIGREEKPDKSHPEGKKDIKEDQSQRAKADRDRNEQSPADKKPADNKDRDRADRPSHQQDQPGNKPLKEGDHSKQKDDHSPKDHADENKSSKDRDKPSKPGTPDRPGSRDDRNRPEKESPGKKDNEITSKETDGRKKPGDREPASRDNTPNHGGKDRNPMPRNEETPSSRPKPPAIPGDHTKPTPASDATTGGSPSSPTGPSLPRDNGNPPNPQPAAPPSSPQNHPAQQPTPDQGGVPHHPDQPTQPNRPSQSDHPNNPSSGGGGKDSPVSKPDGGTTPSSPATPSPNPHGGDRNPPGKPIPQPKPQSPETPGKPAQPNGPGGTPVSPVNERSLIPGTPSSLVPTAPKPASLIPGGGTLPMIPRLDSPASVSEAVVALPGSLFERIFGGHKKRTKTEKPQRTFSSGKEVIAAEKPFRTRKRAGGALFGIIKPELPNLWKAAKVQRVVIDPRITSPRTITYKSRFSRVSRWIAPLTLGIATYIPYETMNASMAARLNNLMAEEEISVEKQVTEGFAAEIAKSRRFRIANPPDAVFELEITRYALDPVPLSIGRMKPTVSVTGRLYDANGQLLWIGKGFSTILEHGIRGATVEQYEDDPEQLRRDFRASVSSAIRRLGAMATVLPRASVTVTPAQ